MINKYLKTTTKKDNTYLSSEVLEDGGQVDWSSGANAFGVVALAKHPMDTSDGELKSGTARAGLCLTLVKK